MTQTAEQHTTDALFARDAVRAAYHLALLEPPYSRHVEWRGHRAPGGQLDAAAAFYHLSRPTIIFLLGEAGGVGGCLASADLPEHAYVAFFPEHQPVLDEFYLMPSKVEMVRMVLGRDEFVRHATDGLPEPVVLNDEHVDALDALYSFDTGFRPDAYQYSLGRYLGIFADGRMVAAAGTHFAAEDRSFAMIGNVLTHPDYRRRGLARLVVQRLLARLFGSVGTVCLNVRGDNAPGVKLYESLGFSARCTYREGCSVLRRMARNSP